MILVTGANGQVGVDLVAALADLHGPDELVVTDLRKPEVDRAGVAGHVLDVTDRQAVEAMIGDRGITTIYHLAGILSATGEKNPDLAWNVNVNGVRHVLEAARKNDCRVFFPSSIAVFGPSTPKVLTPQETITEPETMYGASKVAGELLCRYYASHFGVDVRSLRFPGIISHAAPPGGGTTDWAVDMFFQAVKNGSYECFVSADTRLPMMYMPDAIKSVLDLMSVDSARVTVRTSYNVTSFSITPLELATAIEGHMPGFVCTHAPDFRQRIADSWPHSIDDSRARHDWNWQPEYDLASMVADMLSHVAKRVSGADIQV